MRNGNRETAGEDEVITQKSLLKSLRELEGDNDMDDDDDDDEQGVMIRVVNLEKSFADSLAESDDETVAAIEASDVLADFADSMGLHIDASLEVLEKSINDNFEVQVATISVLEALKKSVDDLAEQVAAFGGTPRVLAKSVSEGASIRVLEKGTSSEPRGAVRADRNKVSNGFIALYKSIPESDADGRAAVTNAAGLFEGTGKIDEEMLAKVLKAAS